MAALAITYPDFDLDPVVALKHRFAAGLLKDDNAAKVALSIEDDPGQALVMAQQWVTDPIVIQEMARLLDKKGDAAHLESKEEILRDIRIRARACKDDKLYVSLMDLYCRVAGHVEKPGNASPTNVVVAPIMVVPMGGSDSDWEQQAKLSQGRLINASLA